MLGVLKLSRTRIAFVHDVAMAALCFPLALYLRLGDAIAWVPTDHLIQASLFFAAIAAVVFQVARLYRGIWRYASLDDLVALTKAVTIAILIFLPVLFFFTRLEWVPRSAPLIQWFLLMAMLGAPRFAYRMWKDRRLTAVLDGRADTRVPVLLVGVGDEAELFIRNQRRDPSGPYKVVGLLAEKGHRVGFELHGLPVLGTVADLERVIAEAPDPKPRRLVLAGNRLDGSRVRDLLERADRLGLTLARLPDLSELKSAGGDAGQAPIRPIAVEDLLGRPQARLDRAAMEALIRGARVLVTGAGGSIGSELVRQIAAVGPAELILLDYGEYQLYEIDLALAESRPDLPRRAVLGDVRDPARIEDVLARLKPDLVFHAAALKHVPMVEANPLEGILTNAVGSRIVADACRKAGVKLMVLISTDKAVNPTNVMGATKRLAEAYAQALDAEAGRDGATRFVTVRFGNVLGSTGSVVPLFQRQLAAGGPLTVTHPDVTRYFMTIAEAVELVLQAAAFGIAAREARGRLFVLDMGEPVRILDLARQMVRLAGMEPDRDIAIEITGLRPGEKLYEELLHDTETRMPTDIPGLLLAAPRHGDAASLAAALRDLETLCRARRRAEALALLRRLTPEYRPAEALPPAASAG